MGYAVQGGYDYPMSYGGSVNSISSSATLYIVALVLALVATVLAFIFLVPEKRREKLNAFGKFLHDTCNFKYLVVEKILQALYIFTTIFLVISGFITLFSDFIAGLIIMLIAPIVVRLVYELLMMTVVLVKNVIKINVKLKNQNSGTEKKEDPFSAPDTSEMRESLKKHKEAIQPAREENNKFCSKCGSPLDENGNCPNCSL